MSPVVGAVAEVDCWFVFEAGVGIVGGIWRWRWGCEDCEGEGEEG